MSRRHKLLLAYLGALVLALGVAGRGPVAFQKSNAIRSTGEFPPLTSSQAFDAATALEALPYRPDPVWAVLPSEKFQRTIVEGGGNCSQRTFGMAWILDQAGRDLQVVHLLPLDSFLQGGGHTLLRTHLAWQDRTLDGLVDMLQGALPLSGDRVIDVADLTAGPIPDFRFAQFGPAYEDASVYYGRFLDSAVIGVISGPAIERYFRFVEAIYVPLGNERIEKLFYDGLALLLGFYPTIEVIETERLFSGRELERAGHQASLWLLRSALVVLPLFLLLEVGARRARA